MNIKDLEDQIAKLQARSKDLNNAQADNNKTLWQAQEDLAKAERAGKNVPLGRLRAKLKDLTGEASDVEFTREGPKTVDVWAYHPGFTNSAMGAGCHLIHEDSVREVYAILADGLTKCDCEDCVDHRAELAQKNN
jgi:hypothetical protein